MGIIKINKEFSIQHGTKEHEILSGDELYSVLLQDGKKFSEIETEPFEREHVQNIETMVSETLVYTLGKENEVEAEPDNQIVIYGHDFNVWIAFTIEDDKISYYCTTWNNNETDERFQDANGSDRKTWVGLNNYINRYI